MQTTQLALSAWDKYVLTSSIFLIMACFCSGQSFSTQFTPTTPIDSFYEGASISVTVNIGPIYQSEVFQEHGIIVSYKPTEFGFAPNQQLNLEQVSASIASCISQAYTDASGQKLIFELLPCEEFDASQISALISGIIITIEDLPARIGIGPSISSTTKITLSNKKVMLIQNEEIPIKKLRIINLSGQLIKESSLTQNAHIHKWNINHLGQGVYILEVVLDDSVYRTKFWLK